MKHFFQLKNFFLWPTHCGVLGESYQIKPLLKVVTCFIFFVHAESQLSKQNIQFIFHYSSLLLSVLFSCFWSLIKFITSTRFFLKSVILSLAICLIMSRGLQTCFFLIILSDLCYWRVSWDTIIGKSSESIASLGKLLKYHIVDIVINILHIVILCLM